MTKSNETSAFERTRRDHATEIMEDYVEAIDEIQSANGSCRVKDLASQFSVSHVTVIKTVQRLERAGMVITQPYKPVELTPEGLKLARKCKARHELVLNFLLAIGVDPQIAAVDAEGIEHHVSPQTLARFKTIMLDQDK